MSFVKDLLNHIEKEDRKRIPIRPREESFQERMLKEDRRQYVPLKPREETFEEIMTKEEGRRIPINKPREENFFSELMLNLTEKDDVIRQPIKGPKKYWEEDPEEFIRKLKLEMEANPNAFRIKTSKRKSKKNSKRKSKKNSKRKISRRRK